MAIVNVLHTIEKLQKYMLHKINFEYIHVLKLNPARKDVFWFIPSATPWLNWLSKFLYTQFYLTLFEYWCIDDILKIAIHQFYVNTNERTIQLWRATIADSLARYYLMRYHFQIKLNTNEDGDVAEAVL